MRGKLDRPGVCLLALCAAHCGGSSGGHDAALGWQLTAVTPEVTMKPSASAEVSFVLDDGAGQPVANQVVSFSLSVQNGADARGATLASDTSVTDASGRASTLLGAGLPVELRVTARSTGAAPAITLVWVSTDPMRSVEVAPYLLGSASDRAASMTRIDVLFFDSSSCAIAAPANTTVMSRPARTVAPGEVTRFDLVSGTQRHAVLARARDDTGRLVASGCLDLQGVVLPADATMRLWLPLADPAIAVAGSFAIESSFRLPDSTTVVRTVAAPWTDLSDCPLDPAQRWLDCTIDALGDGGDPLDCDPGASEGTLAAALTALRGTPAQNTSCRATTTAEGGPSLDADAAALFPSGTGRPALLAALPALGSEAAQLLDDLVLESTLELRATLAPGQLALTHSFSSATLTVADRRTTIDLKQLGLPVLSTFGKASSAAGNLDLEQHGITLRPGTLAHAGFNELTLTSRGLPTTTADLVAALLSIATTTSGAQTLVGCAALDAVLCARVGQPAGCLAQGCEDGRKALIQRLEGAFREADGDSLDLLVAGSVPILDQDGDLLADHLGVSGSASSPGLWSAELRSRAGKTTFSGIWTATRD